MGCGGILGVNAGSADEAAADQADLPPAGRRRPGTSRLVGKGIMYDAGGISLKPSDAMHAAMKLDMSGAAAIFGAMTTLRDLGCTAHGDRLPDVHRQHAVGHGHCGSATC